MIHLWIYWTKDFSNTSPVKMLFMLDISWFICVFEMWEKESIPFSFVVMPYNYFPATTSSFIHSCIHTFLQIIWMGVMYTLYLYFSHSLASSSGSNHLALLFSFTSSHEYLERTSSFLMRSIVLFLLPNDDNDGTTECSLGSTEANILFFFI